jgi:hypothetical protein
MKSTSRTYLSLATLAALAAAAGTIALAQPPADHKQPEMKLPPGWTTEDMQACMVAGTPGKEHEHLAGLVGTWTGTNKMWMAPGTDAMSSPITWTVSPVMDGRYFRTDVAGDMPGMGPFNGMGIAGFDNVSRQFVSTWIDNHSTGIMTGTGELAPDGKTHTWKYTHNCPITRKPTTMREVMRHTGNTLAVEFFCIDPKSGKEYKCMESTLTKSAE